ncbi:MAG TPA: PD-(D/E)XK nuclease family protein [Burkholderiales bacterium]|nr:PD-(D/E)XK nuclease family protein [Burkholderiales bacterium]
MDKADLLARLAEGHAARITVVTPNTRLSQALVSDFDVFQIAKDKTVWEAADILPFSAFVERLYEDALYSDIPDELPQLLTPAQEEWLWAEAIRAAPRELLSIADTAAQCRDAWRLLHAWQLPLTQGTEDTQAFHEWASAYRRRTAGEIDAARLPELLLQHLRWLKLPKLLVAYGFDLMPAQTRAFLDGLGVEVVECKPLAFDAAVSRLSFSSAREELEKAAAWARARLEDRGQLPNSSNESAARSAGSSVAVPDLRIGVVIPDLQLRRAEVVRIFSRTMRPGYNLPGAKAEAMPFNVSLGIPLAQYPVVALALDLLRFSRDELPFPEVSSLILSPFLGGAETELSERARMDVYLRRKADATLTLPKLIGLLDKSDLRARLEKVFAVARDDLLAPQTPSEWARHFTALLEAAGFPGERSPDSTEYQTVAKWNEMLSELSRLERIASRMSFHSALQALKRLCAETLFQPESGDAPIQVLGILESAGLEFDHLWVSGLTDEAWPLQARPNPFVPIALQRKAGIPEASAEGSLALDRRITEGWKTAAKEVVLSSFSHDEDRELAPSPLIADLPETTLDLPVFPRFRDLVFAQKRISSTEDRVAPPVAATKIKGGTRVLADQSACPFRAFARHRLGARELEAPVEGLDAADRGNLLHALMKHLWAALKDSSSLEKDLSKEIQSAAAEAVKELRLEGRFAELERTRLQQLAAEWLDVERRRAPFEVVASEKSQTFTVAGLQFDGRIDRMDRLAGGGHALIDYKTSRQLTPKQWEPPRPDDPQLPLYAVSSKEEVTAVAFAKVRRGEMRLMGFSRDKDALPGVREAKAWKPLLEDWRREAERLGASFASGEARVDPKRELQTCRYCDLHTVCRVYEKVNPLKEDEGADGEGAAS